MAERCQPALTSRVRAQLGPPPPTPTPHPPPTTTKITTTTTTPAHLCKHRVARLIAEGGTRTRHAVAHYQRRRGERQHARHGGGGEGRGVGRQAVNRVLEEEGHLRPMADGACGGVMCR